MTGFTGEARGTFKQASSQDIRLSLGYIHKEISSETGCVWMPFTGLRSRSIPDWLLRTS